MVTIETFRELALSHPDAVEQPHFEKTSFRIKKKIFATLSTYDMRACLKLSEIDQSVFCTLDKSIVYPVDNKWGKMGWTMFTLEKVGEEMMSEALEKAYQHTLKKKK